MKKKYVRSIGALLLAALLPVSLAACVERSEGTTSGGSAGQSAAAGEESAVVLPVREDYPAGPAWDGVSEPTHDNGAWAQSYAVFDALAERAAAYENTTPERTFTLACHDPVESGPGQFAASWANAVTVATEGRVRISVGYSGTLSGAMTSLDDMKQGTVDFVWTLPCYFKGYMPLTNVIQNPALGIANGTAGSYAMWALYASEPALQAEYEDDGVLLFVCTNCTSPISYKGSARIDSVSEITGNIRANNGPAQLFVSEVGATVFGCPIGEVYSNIQHGIINYLVTDWNGIDSFALSDPGVLNYYVDTNIGCSAFALLANRDVWASIDAGLQERIEAASGEYMLNLTGIWDYWDASGRYNATAKGGDLYAPSDAFATELAEAYQNVAETWIAEQADPETARQLYEHAAALVEEYNGKFS